MKFHMKKFAGILLAGAVVLHGAIFVSAAAANYSVQTKDGKLYAYTQSISQMAPLSAKEMKVRVASDKNGVFQLRYNETSDGKYYYVTLTDQKELKLHGDYVSVVLDKSLPSDKTIYLSGKVGTLTVNAPVKVIMRSLDNISKLNNSQSGAKFYVSKNLASPSPTVSSGKTVGSAPKVTVPARTDLTGAVKSSNGKYKTYLSIEELDRTKQRKDQSGRVSTYDVRTTNNIQILGNNTVALEAKAGYSLAEAMGDLSLEVRTAGSNELVGGSWQWENRSDYNTREDGEYIYVFTPSQPDLFDSVSLYVKYTNKNPLGVYNAPVLKFDTNQKSSGPISDTTIDIVVAIPTTVEDNDELDIYVGDYRLASTVLYKDDEIQYEAFTIDLSSYPGWNRLQKGDKIQFRAYLKRNGTSRRVRSGNLTYTISD